MRGSFWGQAMSDAVEEMRELLRAAEEEITRLGNEAIEAGNAVGDLTEHSTRLEMQIVMLTQQISDMEEMLRDAQESQLTAQQLIEKMHQSLTALQTTSKEALEKAQYTTSRVQLAASIYEVATKAKEPDEDNLIIQAQEYLNRQRNRL
jgi:predicted  nucleic acid-binding Zn-ribbon protein